MSYSNQSRATSAYREREILNATPGRLVVIVYDHVLASLFRARAAAAADRLEIRLDSLSKARAGLMELLSTLNSDGVQIAENLRSLYGFLYVQLMEESRTPDARRLDKIVAMVTELRDAFATIAGETVALGSAA